MSEGYASHTTLLTAAFTVTTGSVLELGSGLGSTPMLHGLCGSSGRSLKSVESNQQWFRALAPEYRRDWHQFRCVENFIDLPEYREEWGLVFVDHGIIEERKHSIVAFRDAPMVVVHDTCHPRLYHYDEAFQEFKYQFDLKLFGPHTSVVSNSIDVDELFRGMDL